MVYILTINLRPTPDRQPPVSLHLATTSPTVMISQSDEIAMHGKFLHPSIETPNFCYVNQLIFMIRV